MATTSNGHSNNGMKGLTADQAEEAIVRFQKFLRYETVSALAVESGAYKDCASFLVHELQALGVLSDIHLLPEAPDHSPVVVACWKGKDESLPVILWNSHYDVVPADPNDWSQAPPFEGRRKDGKIYGRGTQDMKSVCMQYIEAIRCMKRDHPEWTPTRTIYLTFVPDEEVGGQGMAALLESSLYQETIEKNHGGIALALDEGLASTTDVFSVFYGERLPWWVDVEATGPTGHGSRFIDNTAVEQLVELSQKALQFRQGQRDLLGMKEHDGCAHAVVAKSTTLGDVTSLNITSLTAGVYAGSKLAYNCVPPKAKCTLDIRISPHVAPKDIGAMLDQWCRECSKDPAAGAQITWKYAGGQGNHAMEHATTSIDTNVNPWYKVFADTLETMGMSLEPQVFPAATDSRFLRALGIRALGFSPMRKTEIMLHENDEYIEESNFLEGIGIYVQLLEALGSQGNDIDK
ncbi:Aminoacylase-1 [Seminavis robusta]|uniref:Aminoacylase-1 n=1 Tax=Seminavis robusta TaxID=568900 RepID=A0A9N8DPU8_9STRA|nr:Aminoacylase-1 [Seminavis robusta]|eukprot:Sro204_g085930.1 Aminoacylase-1 (462) ;mRNA; f:49931-51426